MKKSMIDLMEEDLIDEDGNRHQATNIGSGNTIVRINNDHFDKLTKSAAHQKDIKEQIHEMTQKDPSLVTRFGDIGIDINNIENYLGSVEVLTIARRRIYSVYEDKNN